VNEVADQAGHMTPDLGAFSAITDAVEGGAGNVVDLLAHPVDGPQRPPGQECAQEARRHQDADAHGDKRPEQGRERGADAVVGEYHDRLAAVLAGDASGGRARRRPGQNRADILKRLARCSGGLVDHPPCGVRDPDAVARSGHPVEPKLVRLALGGGPGQPAGGMLRLGVQVGADDRVGDGRRRHDQHRHREHEPRRQPEADAHRRIV